jgi:hypothetical protein
MIVVHQLGQRFLWVDRLCIDQDPANAERHQRIRVMDGIYRAAHAVIAVLGPNADASLPGVSRPRIGQAHALTSEDILVSTMFISADTSHILSGVPAPGRIRRLYLLAGACFSQKSKSILCIRPPPGKSPSSNTCMNLQYSNVNGETTCLDQTSSAPTSNSPRPAIQVVSPCSHDRSSSIPLATLLTTQMR